ncbi:MAG: amidase [Candidatus Hydrogenedentota bacterium]
MELVEAAITRIEAVNPTINAVITPMFELARKAARGPLPNGPFKGVPFVLKDLLAGYGGVPMHAGSRLMEGFVPGHDCELVARYKRAGLVCLGKTNTPEFGILPTTEPEIFGPTRNPWNTDHSTGGSSGGSAAAVASGMVPVAHGNDGGGSIRIPASCCGLFGLKPSRGRITLGPDLGDVANGLVSEHVLTRSVRDSAALLDATCGPLPGDPYVAPAPERLFLQEVGASTGRLRIAYSSETFIGVPVHPECEKALMETVKLCESLGHYVEESAPAIAGDEIQHAFLSVYMASAAWSMDGCVQLTGRMPSPQLLEPCSWTMHQMASQTNSSMYLLGWTQLQRISRALCTWLEPFDAFLTPTTAEPPLPLGSFEADPDNPLSPIMRAAAFVPYTPLCNFTGLPAMSVPLHWTADGLPVGSHFVGKYGQEALLFRLAAQLEEARPWAHHVPPVHA